MTTQTHSFASRLETITNNQTIAIGVVCYRIEGTLWPLEPY